MSISMTRDDALAGLLGGILIGSAAGTLLLFNGDIMGASGIATSVSLNPIKALSDSSQHWKFVFIASFLITSNLAIRTFEPEAPTLSALGYGVSGFLVGFGTKLGNGCTSGHGICGLPRGSKRSLVAVLTFMSTGAVTAVWTKGLFPVIRAAEESAGRRALWPTALGLAALGAAVVAHWFHRCDGTDNKEHRAKFVPAAVSGALFAKGLQISGMALASNVFGFLDVTKMSKGTWNPQLAMVMAGGVIVSFLAYQMVPEVAVTRSKCKTLACPITQPSDQGFTCVPRAQVIDFNLVAGAALFGVGWGLAGLCPGPALFLAGVGAPYVLTQWLPAFWIGSYLADWYKTARA